MLTVLRLLRMLPRPVLILALLPTVRSSLRDMVSFRPLLLPGPIGLLVLIAWLRPALFLPLRLVRLTLRRRGLFMGILFGFALIVLVVLMILHGIALSAHPEEHTQNARTGYSDCFHFHVCHLDASYDQPFRCSSAGCQWLHSPGCQLLLRTLPIRLACFPDGPRSCRWWLPVKHCRIPWR